VLTEKVKDRAAAIDLIGIASRDNVELPRLGGVGISQHGRGDVALAAARMLCCQHR
jgi:hypothetical protein